MAVDKEQVRSAIKDCLEIMTEDCSVSVMLASKVGSKPEPNIFKLVLSTDLADEFKATATKIVADLNADVANNTVDIQEYDAATEPTKNEIEFFESSGSDTPSKILDSLSQIDDLQAYNHGKRGSGNFSFYVIAFHSKTGRNCYLFRKYTKTKQLTRSGKIFALFRDNVFDQISSPIFQFDDDADCIVVENQFIIKSQTSFHSIFNHFAEAERSADASLDTILQNVRIANDDEFRSDCKRNPLLMLKLRSIAKREAIDEISIDDIESVIAEFDLPVKITGSGVNRSIDYNRDVKWHVIKLLEDSYGHSARRHRKIEAANKRYLD